MINRAMSGLGSDKEYAILVGDTAYDIYGAHEAGIKAIGAGYGYGMETELEEAGADYIARSVEDVAMIIRYAFIK